MTPFHKALRRTTMAMIAGSIWAWVGPQAMAQSAPWPTKAIRIVVAFPPGGLTDAYARMYAEQLTAQLGVPAFVDNKPGAGAINWH